MTSKRDWIRKRTPCWQQCHWPGIRVGRYVKRTLSKARRRQAKEEIRGGRVKSISGKESECNWKTL